MRAYPRLFKCFGLILLLLLLAINISSASAQSYRFSIVRDVINVFVNPEGTVSIEYTLDFKNDSGAPKIDFVDLGLPTYSFDTGNITAEVNGKKITDISSSGYQGLGSGVALGLGGNAIQGGQSGTVHVLVGKIEDMLFEATSSEKEKYASFQFSPSWIDSQYVHGKTDLTVTLFLPAGMTQDEPRYFPPESWTGQKDPVSGFDDQNRVFYQWQSKDANSSSKYVFGASFPARLIPDTAITTKPIVNVNPKPSANFLSSLFNNSCPICFVLLFIGLPIGFGILGTVQGEKRKLQYLPPKISIEGHGIKRGLTAVQAAALMENPPDKVLTMILFAVIKKGAARVTTRNPLKLEVITPPVPGLLTYEVKFLEAMQLTNPVEQRRALQATMVDLIKSISEAMKGFSRKETVAYYQDIMRRAWEQVEAAGTPEVQVQKFDEAMDWAMLDQRFPERTREIFTARPVFIPIWWSHFDPTYHPTPSISGSGLPISPIAGGAPVSLPHLPGSDFAASLANGIQSFSANVVGDVKNFTSSITNQTNPVPKTTSSSYRGGGGGRSCACACACAGCACACAGGGR